MPDAARIIVVLDANIGHCRQPESKPSMRRFGSDRLNRPETRRYGKGGILTPRLPPTARPRPLYRRGRGHERFIRLTRALWMPLLD